MISTYLELSKVYLRLDQPNTGACVVSLSVSGCCIAAFVRATLPDFLAAAAQRTLSSIEFALPRHSCRADAGDLSYSQLWTTT
jgi:hypothetical protein